MRDVHIEQQRLEEDVSQGLCKSKEWLAYKHETRTCVSFLAITIDTQRWISMKGQSVTEPKQRCVPPGEVICTVCTVTAQRQSIAEIAQTWTKYTTTDNIRRRPDGFPRSLSLQSSHYVCAFTRGGEYGTEANTVSRNRSDPKTEEEKLGLKKEQQKGRR